MFAAFLILAASSTLTKGLKDCPTFPITYTEASTLENCVQSDITGDNNPISVAISLTVTSCTFSNIVTSIDGGLIALSTSANLVMDSCHITAVSTTSKTGGVILSKTGNSGSFTISITNSDFTECKSKNGGAVLYGKGMTECIIDNCIFTLCEITNSASSDSGVIWTGTTNVGITTLTTIKNSVFNQNIAAGILMKNLHTKIQNVTFNTNEMSKNKIHSAISATANLLDITITDCSFNGNTNIADSGASCITLSSTTIISATIENSYFQSGATTNDIYVKASSIDIALNNCTFIRKSAMNSVFADSGTSLSFTLCCFKTDAGVTTDGKFYVVSSTTPVTFDQSCCIDLTQDAALSITTVTTPSSIFSCTECTNGGDKPEVSYVLPPTPKATRSPYATQSEVVPDQTNPPQSGECPASVPTKVTESVTYTGCNYVSGNALFSYFADDVELKIVESTFTNIFRPTTGDEGGSVILAKSANVKSIELTRCTFTNCGTTKNYGGIVYLAFKDKTFYQFLMDDCSVTGARSNERGSVLRAQNAQKIKVINSRFTDCKTVKETTEGGVFNAVPQSGNYGKGEFDFENCKFVGCNRCLSGKVEDISVKSIVFEDCIHNNKQAGSAIFVQDGAYSIKLDVENCTFRRCQSTSDGARGAAIYIYDAFEIQINNCKFEDCTASGPAVVLTNSTTMSIANNTFVNCNGDLDLGKDNTVLIQFNKFSSDKSSPSIVADAVKLTLKQNCFKSTGQPTSVYFLKLNLSSTVTIEDSNCFNKPRGESIFSDDESVVTASDDVFDCLDCQPAGNDGENAQVKNPTGANTQVPIIAGVSAAIVVIIIVIVVVLVCYCKKSRSNEEGDYKGLEAPAIDEKLDL